MIARRAVLLAALAAALGLAAAGGWGVADCSETERDAILDLIDDCPFGPFDSKQSGVPDVDDVTCPDGCRCSGLGNSTVLVGKSESCQPLAFTANGRSVSAAPGCEEANGCRCFPEKCAYSCADIDDRSCMSQFDNDQDERGDLRKFFTTKNIAIFSGAGAGALLIATCLCCVCCCCLCRKCRGGGDKDSGF